MYEIKVNNYNGGFTPCILVGLLKNRKKKRLISSEGLDIVRNIMRKFGLVNIKNYHAGVQLLSFFF